MRHPYFHKAVMQAYEKLLPSGSFPSYFLFFEINPADIDINVHPTKTEIKFENEREIWQIIHAAVCESLGRHNVVPSIDFNQEGNIDIPLPPKSFEHIQFPQIQLNPEYNPFEKSSASVSFKKSPYEKTNQALWENLYSEAHLNVKPDERIEEENTEELLFQSAWQFSARKTLQLKQKYILTPVKSGIMIIDQRRAHERIIFEKITEVMKSSSVASQQQLFPQKIEMNPADAELLKSILPDLYSLGFDIREFGENTFIISGTPGMLDVSSPEMIVEKLLEEYKNSPLDAKKKAREQIAISLAKASALNYGTELKQEEIDHLIDQLFACNIPNFSPEGKKVLNIITIEDIEKDFN